MADEPKEDITGFFRPIVEKLNEDKNIGRIIIFCCTNANVIAIRQFLLVLG